MRGRHFPRLCRSCNAPMARQEDTCWSCEAAWDYRSARPNARRVIPGGHAARPGGGGQPSAPAGIGSLAAEGSRRIGAQIAAAQ
jgi:hypothetical protein